MGEVVVLKLQDIIQELEKLSERENCDIARWHERTKEEYEKGLKRGFEDGMNKAWAVAEAIVHLRWDGAYVPPQTVEDWFEKYSAQEASKVLGDCQERMREKPHWKKDIVRHVLECSQCGFASMHRHRFCPECGARMEDET